MDFSLLPGQTICIKRLSNILNFSTTPLREALFGLEKDGYVVKSRNDSFHVTQMNRGYVKNLFAYGKILHDHAVRDGRPRTSSCYDSDREASCNSCKSALNIDSVYRRAQCDTDNFFISRQLGIFRFKAASIRSALKLSNENLYSIVYKEFIENNPNNCILFDSFQIMHCKKSDHSEQIAQAVLSYAISRQKNLDNAFSIATFDDSQNEITI